MQRRWIVGIVVIVVALAAIVYFSRSPGNNTTPDVTAADPSLTGTADPAPTP